MREFRPDQKGERPVRHQGGQRLEGAESILQDLRVLRRQVGDRVRIEPSAAKYNPESIVILAARKNVAYTVGQTDYPKGSGSGVKKGGKLCVLLREINTWCACENLTREA